MLKYQLGVWGAYELTLKSFTINMCLCHCALDCQQRIGCDKGSYCKSKYSGNIIYCKASVSIAIYQMKYSSKLKWIGIIHRDICVQ